MSERLSLQCLLKINVVHSQPLVERMDLVNGYVLIHWGNCLGNFLQFLRWQVDKNRLFWDIKRDFAVWLSFLYLASFLECWKIKLKAVLMLMWVMISDWMWIWLDLWLWVYIGWSGTVVSYNTNFWNNKKTFKKCCWIHTSDTGTQQ